jgi:hypothetical protein
MNNKKDIEKKKSSDGTKEKHPGGRPEEYKEEYCQMLIDYFDTPKWYEREVTHQSKNGEYTTCEIEPNPMPQFSIFARKVLKVSKQTLLNWADKHQEFMDAYNTCKEIQKEFILENGMAGRYNPQFTKFVAINVTDMKDKTEVDNNIKAEITEIRRTIVKPKEEKQG